LRSFYFRDIETEGRTPITNAIVDRSKTSDSDSKKSLSKVKKKERKSLDTSGQGTLRGFFKKV